MPVQNPMCTGTNFYPLVWVRVRISTRSLFVDGWVIALPDPLSSLYFVDHDIIYLLITSLPGKVGLAEYVCTHLFIVVFLVADLNYVPEELK
jgi:hypothetical protein